MEELVTKNTDWEYYRLECLKMASAHKASCVACGHKVSGTGICENCGFECFTDDIVEWVKAADVLFKFIKGDA